MSCSTSTAPPRSPRRMPTRQPTSTGWSVALKLVPRSRTWIPPISPDWSTSGSGTRITQSLLQAPCITSSCTATTTVPTEEAHWAITEAQQQPMSDIIEPNIHSRKQPVTSGCFGIRPSREFCLLACSCSRRRWELGCRKSYMSSGRRDG